MKEALQIMDCSVIEGHRGQELQDKYFAEGRSFKKFPDGKHNSIPSQAVHALPYPIDWKDTRRMTLFAGIVLAVGHMKGIRIRWGGDWDMDTEVKDNTFDDLAHFELMGAL